MSTKCPKCQNTTFEMAEEPVYNASYRYNFIRCSNCGCAIGVQEYHNLGALIYKLAKKLNIELDEKD